MCADGVMAININCEHVTALERLLSELKQKMVRNGEMLMGALSKMLQVILITCYILLTLKLASRSTM